MSIAKILFVLSIFFLFLPAVSAQTKPKVVSPPAIVSPVKSSPAYAEVLLRKTDLEADLEDLLINYTEEYPKVKDTRYELGLISATLDKILAVDASQSPRLTLALGKLLVRKAELETDLWSLQNKYGKDHVEVKRAARKVDVFEKAVKEILP